MRIYIYIYICMRGRREAWSEAQTSRTSRPLGRKRREGGREGGRAGVPGFGRVFSRVNFFEDALVVFHPHLKVVLLTGRKEGREGGRERGRGRECVSSFLGSWILLLLFI